MKNKLLLIISLMAIIALAFAITAFATEETNIDDTAYITVTYNSNGGSTVESQKVLPGSKLTAPKSPTKTGYDFAGWYITTDKGEEEWSFVGYIATEDMTLNAKWVPNDEMPPMEVKIDGKAFLNSLGLMGKGMIGIFVVTLVIIGVVAILNWHGRSLENRRKK